VGPRIFGSLKPLLLLATRYSSQEIVAFGEVWLHNVVKFEVIVFRAQLEREIQAHKESGRYCRSRS
jgi:predicted metal-dependent TIM-barrel fold hydrolase